MFISFYIFLYVATYITETLKKAIFCYFTAFSHGREDVGGDIIICSEAKALVPGASNKLGD